MCGKQSLNNMQEKNANSPCIFFIKYDDNILKENILKLHIF